jgi:hypothetical protein
MFNPVARVEAVQAMSKWASGRFPVEALILVLICSSTCGF